MAEFVNKVPSSRIRLSRMTDAKTPNKNLNTHTANDRPMKWLATLMLLPILATTTNAQEVQSKSAVKFEPHILPIFQKSCFDCHSDPAQRKGREPDGGLRLDSPDSISNGGNAGSAIVAGKPDESLLYQLITLSNDDDAVMPARGDLLTRDQISLVRKWIESGADFGTWKGGVNATSVGNKTKIEVSEAAKGDEIESGPMAPSVAAREIDQLVADELKRLGQAPRSQIDD